jgi:tetratricopeptide (TPR) repeat protein
MKGLGCAVILAMLSGGLAAPAEARAPFDKSTEAKAHYELGMTAYGLGHFDRAIEAFTQAYRFDPAPILLFNIAQAHRKKGDRDQAIVYYRRYLDAAPGAEDREQVQQRIRELEASEPERPGGPAGAAAGSGPALAAGGSDPTIPLARTVPVPAEPPVGGLAGGTQAPPLYKRPWFWQVVGAAALVTVATLFLTRPDRGWSCGPPECNLPTRTVE